MTGWRCLIFSVALVLGGELHLAGGSAQAQGFGGLIEYTGDAGPIGSQRPLCLCVYSDAQLLGELGCFLFRTNAVRYRIDSLGAGEYYLIVFVDVHINERLDPDEPFEIYHDRALQPADPVGGQSGAMNIDFVFGDPSGTGNAHVDRHVDGDAHRDALDPSFHRAASHFDRHAIASPNLDPGRSGRLRRRRRGDHQRARAGRRDRPRYAGCR